MRYINILFILILLAAFLEAVPAAADTRYVVDELIITLRIGKSTSHKILKSLKTGTPLEVLEDDDKTYLKVRTTDGVEGYVLSQYVTATPPKTLRIEELEKRNTSLQEKIAALEADRNSLQIQLDNVQAEYKQKYTGLSVTSADLEQNLARALKNERLTTEKYNTLLAQAENVVEITAERDLLRQKNKKQEAELAELTDKTDKLADSRMIKWFLAGGGVFLFGWLIGKISRKKRSSF